VTNATKTFISNPRIFTNLLQLSALTYGNNNSHHFMAIIQINLCLQCFDAVGWVAGRASGL